MTTVAILHTTTATIALFRDLVSSKLPEATVFNFVDDSVLPGLMADPERHAAIHARLLQYGRFAEDSGAQVLLEACSSIGEIVPKLREILRIPVVRIDEPMAEAAVKGGRRIGVVATLASTLEPTAKLLFSTAAAAGRDIVVSSIHVQDAYRKLMAGDLRGHDRTLLQKVRGLLESVDVVVLAQASMARLIGHLSPEEVMRCYASPVLAIDRVREVLSEQS